MTTTSTTDYNGWPNYATWNVNLWIMNEEPSYREWQRLARLGKRWTATLAKSFVSSQYPDGTPDMSRSAMLRASYRTLAKSWNDDIKAGRIV